jgi:ABC-type lipoprotein export system ATPase subunit
MTVAVDVQEVFVVHRSGSRGIAALQGLSLQVEEGEIVVVAGPSGSGKSTLLRLLAGLEAPSAGHVAVHGTDLGRLSTAAADLYRAGTLGILDQHYARSLSPDLTCIQSVALQLELAGGDPRSNRSRALQLLDRVGLADRASSFPGALSGGEQQRVAVCAALVHRPRLLLADEPAGELDEQSGKVVYRLLGELVRADKATAVVVSHDAAAEAIADRLVRICDGRVVEESSHGGPARLVVGGGGWVRIPELFLRELGSPDHLTVESRDGGLVLDGLGSGELQAPASSTGTQAARPEGHVAETRSISKRYGDRRVLTAFDLSATAGRFSTLVGRSGSGKTTVLHIFAGLELPDDGEVLLVGESLLGRTRQELAELRRRHVALVTQEPGLVPYFSAFENVELGLRLRRAQGDIGARAESALDEVGLLDRRHTAAARLSAGERQRVAIARALAADVALLLVDEPTARLDEANGRAVGRLLAAAAHERGLAVVAATHDAALVELADEVVQLRG